MENKKKKQTGAVFEWDRRAAPVAERRFGGLLPGINRHVASCMACCQVRHAALAWRGTASRQRWPHGRRAASSLQQWLAALAAVLQVCCLLLGESCCAICCVLWLSFTGTPS